MVENLLREIRAHLGHYVSGKSSLREFRDWFDVETWESNMRPDTPLGQVVGEIELRLAEFTNGHRTEDDLRATLQPLLQRETVNNR